MIITTTVQAQVEVQCSMCHKIEEELPNSPDCVVSFNFGYGSDYDMDRGKTYFCPKCADKVYEVLKREFPQVEFTTPNKLYS